MTLAIALDAMGGDHAPQVVVAGADMARQRYPELSFRLFGDRDQIAPLLKSRRRLAEVCTLEHTPDRVGPDARPSQVLRQGRNTSMRLAIDSVQHGSTGTGTPVMPRVETLAAFWGVGNVYINGELAQPERVMHMMTTEVVRDRDYHLALQEEMPLSKDEKIIKDQPQHTHLVVLPIKVGKEGPEFNPLKTAFKLPNGKPQPFMHIMFEQDEFVQ